MPLAIELAAARTRTMSPREILERLDSALSLLVGGARDLPERQRTVRSTIEWSVRLLDADATAAFQALSVFAGPFTIEAAEAVLAASDIDAFTCIEALVDASLLWQRERNGVRVFGMLVLVRAFAREGADAEASAARSRERWVAYYVDLARAGSDAHARGGSAELDAAAGRRGREPRARSCGTCSTRRGSMRRRSTPGRCTSTCGSTGCSEPSAPG